MGPLDAQLSRSGQFPVAVGQFSTKRPFLSIDSQGTVEQAPYTGYRARVFSAVSGNSRHRILCANESYSRVMFFDSLLLLFIFLIHFRYVPPSPHHCLIDYTIMTIRFNIDIWPENRS